MSGRVFLAVVPEMPAALSSGPVPLLSGRPVTSSPDLTVLAAVCKDRRCGCPQLSVQPLCRVFTVPKPWSSTSREPPAPVRRGFSFQTGRKKGAETAPFRDQSIGRFRRSLWRTRAIDAAAKQIPTLLAMCILHVAATLPASLPENAAKRFGPSRAPSPIGASGADHSGRPER